MDMCGDLLQGRTFTCPAGQQHAWAKPHNAQQLTQACLLLFHDLHAARAGGSTAAQAILASPARVQMRGHPPHGSALPVGKRVTSTGAGPAWGPQQCRTGLTKRLHVAWRPPTEHSQLQAGAAHAAQVTAVRLEAKSSQPHCWWVWR